MPQIGSAQSRGVVYDREERLGRGKLSSLWVPILGDRLDSSCLHNPCSLHRLSCFRLLSIRLLTGSTEQSRVVIVRYIEGKRLHARDVAVLEWQLTGSKDE